MESVQLFSLIHCSEICGIQVRISYYINESNLWTPQNLNPKSPSLALLFSYYALAGWASLILRQQPHHWQSEKFCLATSTETLARPANALNRQGKLELREVTARWKIYRMRPWDFLSFETVWDSVLQSTSYLYMMVTNFIKQQSSLKPNPWHLGLNLLSQSNNSLAYQMLVNKYLLC